MSRKEVLIQAINAIPNNEFTLSQSLTCEINAASLVCILGQRANILNAYMEMLAGINEPCAGVVNYPDSLLDEEDSGIYYKIRYIYHNSALLSTLNGLDNVKVPALYHHIGTVKEINEEIDGLLSEFEYDANNKVLPAFMDALQKKHLLTVRAIMLKPSVLFIENPFMGLDGEQSGIFARYLLSLVRKKNITIVVSNVDWGFVRNYANLIVYLSADDIHVFTENDDFSAYIKTNSV